MDELVVQLAQMLGSLLLLQCTLNFLFSQKRVFHTVATHFGGEKGLNLRTSKYVPEHDSQTISSKLWEAFYESVPWRSSLNYISSCNTSVL
jgi:hypothetical protein